MGSVLSCLQQQHKATPPGQVLSGRLPAQLILQHGEQLCLHPSAPYFLPPAVPSLADLSIFPFPKTPITFMKRLLCSQAHILQWFQRRQLHS